MTWLLVALNLAAFALELRQGSELEPFLRRWGLVAADVSSLGAAGTDGAAVLVTLLTSQFLHTGWLHLLANLLYLAVFGRLVEQALGGPRLLGLYLLCGTLGGLAHVLARPQAVEPAIGASGAVAGVIAAHLVLYPGATLGSLAPVLFVTSRRDVPTVLLLVVWLVVQVLGSLATMTESGGVAWWAHVGGFASGLLLASALRRPRVRLR